MRRGRRRNCFRRGGIDDGRFRQSVFLSGSDKYRENSGHILNRGRAAAIGRTEPVAENAFHTEAGLAGVGLAKRLLVDPDLKPGKIRKLFGEPCLSLRVGKCFLAPELIANLALVISGDQDEMGISKRLAISTTEDANRDGLVMDNRIRLIRATYGCAQKRQCRKRNCKRSDHAWCL